VGVRDKIAKALMGAVGGPNKLGAGGIDVYHSSPHTFDKFDLGKIGSGEGAQVYGHGLYFAENPAVSGQGGQYWNQFQRRFEGTPEGPAASLLRAHDFDRQKALEYSQWNLDQLKDAAKGLSPEQYAERYGKLLSERQAQHDLLASGAPVGPRTYEANIKADPVQFLDWDKRLAEQSPYVLDGARRLGVSEDFYALPGGKLAPRMGGPTGQDLYQSIANPRGTRSMSRNQEAAEASTLLGNYGVPGIKYLDEGSRNARPVLKTDRAGNVISSEYAPPTSNYVVFDPANIDIRKMYAAPVAAAPLLGAIGDESKYEVQP